MHHIHKGSCQLEGTQKKAINIILTIANAARFQKSRPDIQAEADMGIEATA